MPSPAFKVSIPKSMSGARARTFFDSPEFRNVRRQWLSRVSAFTLRRFDAFSRGGGNWAPLALSTVKGRRSGGSGRNPAKATRSSLARDTRRSGGLVAAGKTVAILKDTGLLRNALRLSSPGNAARDIPNGVAFGISGGPAHIRAGATKIGGTASVGQIARWHQDGAGHNPERRIIVKPDATTLEAMRRDLLAGFKAKVKRGAV